jgi:hypothetical protein
VDAQSVLRSIAQALKYCHDRNVVHRDLKPENLLFRTTDPNSDIKIADFGFASKISNENLRTQVGTPNYIAPEILNQEPYNSSVDMWSFGVIAFILLCGYPPFHADSDTELFRLIKAGAYTFDPESWDCISIEAKDMIRNLLRVNPSQRLTADGVLKHEWMTNTPKDEDMSRALSQLRHTLARRRLKSSIGAVFAVNKLKSLMKLPAAPAAAVKVEKKKKIPKPKPVHPWDLSWVTVALLPLVTVVVLTAIVFQICPSPKDPKLSPWDAAFGMSILLYLAILHSSRCATLGLHYLGEILWGCNIALLLAGVGITTNRPLMVGGAVCIVAVDQLSWYIDIVGYIITRKFPVGVAKYMLAKHTTWVHVMTGTHHVWFIPVSIFWLRNHGGIPSGSYWASVSITSIIAIAARFLTPYSIRNGTNNQDVRVWNINLCYEFYDDVAIPPLHILDQRPAYIYLPFLIIVCNFILNVIPVAAVIALSRLPFGGPAYRASDWLLFMNE